MLKNIKRAYLLNKFKNEICDNCKREIMLLSTRNRDAWTQSESVLCKRCQALWSKVKEKCRD